MPESGRGPLGRIAGIDFGTVRIGVAISDANGSIASPLETYVRRDEAQDRRWFEKLVADEHVTRFVVGLPVHLDGRESAKSTEARAFGRWLAVISGLPVEYFDERFTTHDAQVFLSDARLSKKKRQARLDKLAAQIILTAYLENRRTNPDAADEPLRGLDE